MQFSDQVNWSLFDFLVMALLLTFLSLFIEVILRKVRLKNRKLGYIFIVILFFFLLWAEMAVGIFGSPIAGS
jgi:uncharacterized membrane protein